MTEKQTEINKMQKCLAMLFPLTRSITGNGNRETLKILQKLIPLQIKEIPSGKKVYDWNIPKEWNIKDGWIKNSRGEKIVDFKKNNLHVVSYSQPIHAKVTFSELEKHLNYKKDLPESIPYRTSYYNEYWGFCVSYNDFKKYFAPGEKYDVFIDSEFKNGALSYGELLIHGKSKEEFLISTYICHPSLANDNLSGVVLTAFLAKKMLEMDLAYSYRIIFVPETIGAIAYCHENEKAVKKIKAGMVVTCVGGPGNFSLKPSFERNGCIDVAARKVLKNSKQKFTEYDFVPNGSDERQYSSPGFRIPCISICRDKYYEYDFYHTSLDNLSFVSAKNIFKSLEMHLKLVREIDSLIFYKRTEPYGELQLGKRGLYPKVGGANRPSSKNKPRGNNELDTILGILFYADGKTSIDQIAEKTQIPKKQILEVIKKLAAKKVLYAE